MFSDKKVTTKFLKKNRTKNWRFEASKVFFKKRQQKKSLKVKNQNYYRKKEQHNDDNATWDTIKSSDKQIQH